MKQIIADEREIGAIHFDAVQWSMVVGQDNITRFEPYGEPGQGAYVPFIAVFRDFGNGEEVSERIPAHLVRISYKSS